MPPKSINPSSSAHINETIISDEDIVSSLANKLNIKEKQIRLYPKRRGCCYLEIDNHSVEAMLALKKVVEEYLYQGMIRRNSVTFDQEKITLSLYKEQIEVIIGEKLSKEQSPICRNVRHESHTMIPLMSIESTNNER